MTAEYVTEIDAESSPAELQALHAPMREEPGPSAAATAEKYDAHLAVDDARLARMEVTTGVDTPEYAEAWCDRMSYAHNCGPVAEAQADEPELEAR